MNRCYCGNSNNRVAEDSESNRELVYGRTQKGYILVQNQKKDL